MSIFTGVGVAMITPFNENGVNFDAFGKHIDFLIDNKVDALFVLGTTGEPSTMTLAEKESVLTFALERVNKRVPVFAGSGGNNTVEAIKFSARAEELGADGLLVVTPYYNKCTQNGVVAHYKAISDAVSIPMIAYNVPTRTGFNIAPATVLKLAEIENVVAIKEASGDIDQVLDVAAITRGKLDFFSGDDSLTVPAMSIGAKGVISVAANIIPAQMHEMTQACINGDYKAASEIHFEIAQFTKALFSEVNPIPCKHAANLLGFDMGIPRMPLTEMEKDNADKLEAIMRSINLIK